MQVPFFKHDLGEPELLAMAEVLRGPILTTGETVDEFERRFAASLQAPYSIGVTSCTGAMHLVLEALGIGPGHEVITTPMTFIATATAVIQCGARPVFVDVDPTTGLMDLDRIEGAITSRTRALLPVHLYGQMCDMLRLRDIASAHGLSIIEDAAHCIEGVRDGVRPGQLSDAACFSFYSTKSITCGEGGAVVTNCADLAQKLRAARSHGMTKVAYDRFREGYQHWDMPTFGWKYNMNNLQAAMLLPQLDRLRDNWHKRCLLASQYEDRLSNLPTLKWPKCHEGVTHARHLFPVLVPEAHRDSIIAQLRSGGVESVVNYRAIHLLTYFRDRFAFKPCDFPHAEQFGRSVLSLPLYPTMTVAQVSAVGCVLREILSAIDK